MSSLNTSNKTDNGQLPRYQALYLGYRAPNKELKELSDLIEFKVNEKLSEIVTRINNLEGTTRTVSFDYNAGHRQLTLNFKRGILSSSSVS